MQAFTQLTSKVIPLPMKDVDTDMIIPAQFLTQINRDGYGQFVFKRLKEQDPNFVFNQQQYAGAEILISESNFGCGSSREHAVWALQQAGIKVILASSYSDIFFNNSVKNGLLLVQLPAATIDEILRQAQTSAVSLTIDLAQQTVVTSAGEKFNFDYDSFRKECLLQGYDDLDYLLAANDKINAYEQQTTLLGDHYA